MKLSAGKLKSELNKLGELMDRNFDTTGEPFAAKVVEVAGQVPKGVFDKLSFLASLSDKLEKNVPIAATDLKQAGYWINAVWPYLSNGVERKSRWPRRIALILILLLAAATYFFLR